MAIKMDTLVGTIKSSQNNQIMMGSFNKITHLLNYSKQPNIEIMANDLQRFENVMDEMLVNGKVMDEIMNKNTLSSDSTAEAMMQNLKMELALEVLFWLFRRNKSMRKQCSSSKCRSKNKWMKTFKTSSEIFDYMHNLFYHLEYFFLNNS